MSALIEEWLVLPDRVDVRRKLTEWPWLSRCVLRHASGRPWLVGFLDQDELTLVSVGSKRVVVIGSCPLTTTQLTELITPVRSVAELDAVARVLPGCWHLVASIEGVVRVQGSLSGLRRVFHCRVGGVPVAGARADVLARVAGAGIDERTLAVRVACGPVLPPPVGERSCWRGIWALPADHYLRIDPGGAAGERRWWRAPEPEVSLTAGAGAVGAALEAAVAARTPGQGRWSADLSGGLDSTSLCFLASRADAELVTFRWAEADVANDDAVFAAHAAAKLPRARHVILPQSEMPDVFADAGDNGDTESPYAFTRTLARSRHSASLLAAHGARVHLAGHGGDELFHSPLAYLHPLARRRPRTAFRHVRGHRALGRWTWASTLSALIRGGSEGDWWHRQAGQLAIDPVPRRAADLDWGYPLRAAAWVTPAALDTARALLRATGDAAQPLASDRGQHVALATVRMMGPRYRQLAGVFATAGLRLELPYLDDRVIETALAVRTHERRTPWLYKPLLAEAMRGVLPEVIAARRTKGEFGEDVRVGLNRHLGEILEFFADSALAAHGLIDPDVLRATLLAPRVCWTTMFALEDLLGCESWLRATPTTAPLGRTDAAATAF